jgi:hypothetical protein
MDRKTGEWSEAGGCSTGRTYKNRKDAESQFHYATQWQVVVKEGLKIRLVEFAMFDDGTPTNTFRIIKQS